MATNKELRKKLHTRIWSQGFIAASIFIVLLSIMAENRVVSVFVVQFITFYVTWVLIHYFIFRKQFKALKD